MSMIAIQEEKDKLAAMLEFTKKELEIAMIRENEEKLIIESQAETINKLGEEIRKLTSESEELKSELKNTQEKLYFKEKLSQDLLEHDTKNVEIQFTLEKRLEGLDIEVIELRGLLAEKEMRIDALATELESLKEKTDAKIKELETDTEFKNTRIMEMAEHLERNETTILKFEATILGLNTQNEGYLNQINSLTDEIARLQFQLQESNSYIAELKSQATANFERINELDGLYKMEQQKNETQVQVNESLNKEYSQLTEEASKMKIEITKITEEKVNLEGIIEKTKESMKNFEKEVEENKKVSEKMEQALGALETNLEALEKVPITKKTTIIETKVTPRRSEDSVVIDLEKSYSSKSSESKKTPVKSKPEKYDFSWNAHVRLQEMMKETAKKLNLSSSNGKSKRNSEEFDHIIKLD